jgi:hypothetical protein
MTRAEQIWITKTDEQLSEASTQLVTYTAEGERVIRATVTFGRPFRCVEHATVNRG